LNLEGSWEKYLEADKPSYFVSIFILAWHQRPEKDEI